MASRRFRQHAARHPALARILPRVLVAATCLIVAGAAITLTVGVVAGRGPWAPTPLPHPRALPDGTRGLGGRITSVTDGDTVEIDFGPAGTERVRLIGIDTPETVHPTKDVECWGPEASARMEELLPPGTQILGQRDVEARDRYGRLLLYLWRADDGMFVNRLMLEEGHAVPLAIAPNNTRRAEMSAASATARAAGLGLWEACEPEP